MAVHWFESSTLRHFHGNGAHCDGRMEIEDVDRGCTGGGFVGTIGLASVVSVALFLVWRDSAVR